MFTAAPIKSGATYLSQHLTANDYYSENEMVAGRWIGAGAEILTVAGREIGAQDQAFEALRENRHPSTGATLTQRQTADRVAFYDFQVSAPKSVSVLAVTFGDVRLRQAHEESVATAFSQLEQYAARRVRSGERSNSDDWRFTGNLVVAAFTHDASRALDAQLHTHLVCANATFDRTEGRWYALQNREMFGAVELAGRIYQNELAQRVQALGYSLRHVVEKGKVKGFEIEGLTPADLEVQSTRRKQIEAAIERFRAERGRDPTSVERHHMATSTRSGKLAEISTAAVRENQLARYAPADRDRIVGLVSKSREMAVKGPLQQATPAREAVISAISHISEREAVFDQRAVLTAVLRDSPGAFALSAARNAIAREMGISVVALTNSEVTPGNPEDRRLLTTKENLALEKESVRLVQESLGKCSPLSETFQLPAELSQDQRVAVSNILASRDGVIALRGPAGTGKTTALSSLDQAIKAVQSATGMPTVYVAPTHQAKGVLRQDGFSDAVTIAAMLTEIRNGRAQLAGKLLVVDEAGMQSTRQGHDLLSAAIKSGARVLLVGDQKQLPAVEAGSLLTVLMKHSSIRVEQLSTIFRQRSNPEYLRAMEVMSKGDVKTALSMLSDQGRITEAGPDYLKEAARAYCAEIRAMSDGKAGGPASVALVAATWAEIKQLNAMVREERKQTGELSGPEVRRHAVESLNLTAEQRRSSRSYEVGMVVSPSVRGFAGMKPGCWYRIEAVRKDCVVLDNGRKLSLRREGQKLVVGRQTEINVQVGDRLLLQGNDRASALTNGMRGYVTAVEPNGTIRFREDHLRGASKPERVIPASYRTLTHGYATTIHASQGRTVVTVIGAVGRQISGHLWNVLTSRARWMIRVFVPEKQSTIDRAPHQIADRPAALDYVRTDSKQVGPARKASPVQPRSPTKTASAMRTRLQVAVATVALRFKTAVSQKLIAGPLRSIARALARPCARSVHVTRVI